MKVCLLPIKKYMTILKNTVFPMTVHLTTLKIIQPPQPLLLVQTLKAYKKTIKIGHQRLRIGMIA